MSFKFQDQKDVDQSQFDYLWKNNGLYAEVVPGENEGVTRVDSHRVTWEDAISHPNAPVFIKTTIENYIREAIEPMAILTNLFQRINYKSGVEITIGSVGAMYAADINEGMEYPERTLNFGPGAKIARIGKSGVAFKITDEVKRYSQFDIINMHLRAAANALVRHKEQKAFNMLSALGVTTHDNITPSASVFGVTGGRRLAGDGNGTLVVENIFEAYGQMLMNGFVPNALMVHPLTFVMFQIDPVLRAFAMQNGGGQFFSGLPGFLNRDPWKQGLLGGQGPSGGTRGTHPGSLAGYSQAPLNGYNPLVQGGLTIPNYLGLPLSVIVSPFIPYNVTTRLTDIYLVDTNNLAAYIVDEEATMEEIPDRLRDLTKVKLRERYTFGMLNDGLAACILKNVKVAQNEIAVPVTAQGPTISSITRGTGVLDSNGAIVAGNGLPL